MEKQWGAAVLALTMALSVTLLVGCPPGGPTLTNTFALSFGSEEAELSSRPSDIAYAVTATSDGGFLVAGTVAIDYNNFVTAQGLYAVKIDAQGVEEWSTLSEFGVQTILAVQSVYESTPGEYQVSGVSRLSEDLGGGVYTSYPVIAAGRLYNEGEGATWRAFRVPTAHDYNNAVTVPLDDGFVMASRDLTTSGILVTRFNGDETVAWTVSSSDESFGAIDVAADGFLVSGTRATAKQSGPPMPFVRKLDASGDVVWDKEYATAPGFSAERITVTSDGGFAVGGNVDDVQQNYVLRMDANGDLLWQRSFGGKGTVTALAGTGAGGLLVCGEERVNDLGAVSTRILVVRADAQGNDVWRHVYGGNGADRARAVMETSDGGCILAGGTASFTPRYINMYIVKTNSLGFAPITPRGWDDYGPAKK